MDHKEDSWLKVRAAKASFKVLTHQYEAYKIDAQVGGPAEDGWLPFKSG